MSSRAVKLSPLAAAQHELDAAKLRVQEVAAQKYVALHESDQAWSAWIRQRELADAEVSRLGDIVAELEAEAASAEKRAELEKARRSYADVAKQCSDTAEFAKMELPKAWAILANVLEAFAKAENARQRLARELPNDFNPGDLRIVDPDLATRCRPSYPEKIISKRAVELWVDPKTGNRFADQSKAPTVTSVKRPFNEVTYQSCFPANDVSAFYRGLKIPRFNTIGPEIIFDGAALHGPHDVLTALQRIRERVEFVPPIMIKYEPIEPSPVVEVDDNGPLVTSS